MSAILAFVTALTLILIQGFRSKKLKDVREPVLVKRFVHPGHGWLRETEDGHVVVGMDNFAQIVLGAVHEVKLPRLLQHVEQGEVAWEVWHGNRRLRIVSPVSGWVVEKNAMVLQNPSLINSAPYGDGWLIKVKPYRLAHQLHNMLTGRAVQQWLDSLKDQLTRVFNTTPALLMQDGGVLLEDLSERCSDEEWRRIAKEFFLAE
jgi:glycine cleavage system H protein